MSPFESLTSPLPLAPSVQDNDDRPPTRRVHVAFIAKAQADVAERFVTTGT
jgi:hypothetical protein